MCYLELLTRAHTLGAQVGARLLLDCSQSVPNMPVDVQALGADWIVATGHKMCGPTGIGFLWGRCAPCAWCCCGGVPSVMGSDREGNAGADLVLHFDVKQAGRARADAAVHGGRGDDRGAALMIL